MAPAGLVITKLGIQATATDDVVRGLMCLKISLPKDSEARPGARWALFNSTPPRLLSTPIIHPLPLPVPSSRDPQLRTASKILALPLPSIYPPSSPSGLGGKPYIDISSTTGKVYLVIDPISSRRNSQTRASGSTSQSTSRKEWLICMEFEVPLENGVEEGISKVLLPIPKCLDNTIRFQILSPNIPTSSSSSSSLSSLNQEVNILTDPKMLPLPANAFKSSTSSHRANRHTVRSSKEDKGKGKIKSTVGEDGWEDGEEDTDISDDEGDDSGGGSWLEGRFPSTEVLRLEWSFNSASSSDIPSLQISPRYDKQSSTISIAYVTQIPMTENPISFEIDVPDGWGWSDFTVQGENLMNWRCVDGGWGVSETNLDDSMQEAEYEDSFATVRAKSAFSRKLTPASSTESGHSDILPTIRSTNNATSSSASLMRQTFPSLHEKMEDFSFEMASVEHKPATPTSLRKSPLQMLLSSTSSKGHTSRERPRAGKSFNLYLGAEGDRTIAIQGTLSLIDSMTLVSPSIPMKIPFIRFENQTSQCQVECPWATYGSSKTESSQVELVDIALGGRLAWTGQDGSKFSTSASPLKGDVKVRLRRSPWGIINAFAVFPFPSSREEVGFSIDCYEDIRLLRSTIDGKDVARTMYSENHNQQIRLGKHDQKPGGVVEVEWEMTLGTSGVIGLPVFESTGDGSLKVELSGDEWSSSLPLIKTNMKRDSPNSLTYPLASSIEAKLSLPVPGIVKSRRKTLLSLSNLINLILLWLLLSMGQQLQRLKSEIDFVRDEYKDLRDYGIQLPNQVSEIPITTATVTEVVITTSTQTADQQTSTSHNSDKEKGNLIVVERNKYDLGRVVRGNIHWGDWLTHPTVRTITRGVGWFWNTLWDLVLP
uniref:Uncharacterized protein n=1 Tax=Kwoniella pini CBS 10737 TaxID=1296096 RepID=A0A1B9I4T8_9TREE|nr:uncharacterized protein I206_03864 [Kwoniella pini CBS 10737]OCF50539.1 hypothetical protein I206_03864 [Kwoniella pini CBS 10737]